MRSVGEVDRAIHAAAERRLALSRQLLADDGQTPGRAGLLARLRALEAECEALYARKRALLAAIVWQQQARPAALRAPRRGLVPVTVEPPRPSSPKSFLGRLRRLRAG